MVLAGVFRRTWERRRRAEEQQQQEQLQEQESSSMLDKATCVEDPDHNEAAVPPPALPEAAPIAPEPKTSSVSSLPVLDQTAERTSQMQVVEHMIDLMNQQDMEWLHCFRLGARVIFKDVNDATQKVLDVAGLNDTILKMFASFPNLHTALEDFYQVEQGDHIVHVAVTMAGTHTGVPYRTTTYTQPLVASNLKVTLDPEEWILTVSPAGKISEWKIVQLGKYSGPDGLYVKSSKAARKKAKREVLSILEQHF